MSVENLNENPEETQSQDDLVTTEVTEPTEDETTEVVSNIVVTNEEQEVSEDAETFPRSYVEKLRKEAAGHRDRAKRADDLAARLHTALVEGTGRLADARDLPFDESHLDDPVALSEAIDAVLADKPHLATRKPMGNIGQGVAPVSNDVSLGGILRAGAM
ncbi:hypothetical protein [Glutamicibacter sp.]|jgi:hypothetical protein|uniref:hypothetical protein n=1 Tax=Glutamicibacter sp. TaxID=1931995 RepID=UPI002B4A4A67|nr:hypothetical protein [Glutamicibacter sp.]HJX80277.1 hypothetical protein [Glutamicibacter sp.]